MERVALEFGPNISQKSDMRGLAVEIPIYLFKGAPMPIEALFFI